MITFAFSIVAKRFNEDGTGVDSVNIAAYSVML